MSSITSATSSSSKLRLTGMATGLDVDATVKQMMSAYNTKLDKMKQDRQIVQWKQELYRDIIGDINTFKSSYFDQLNRDNYMLSSSNYAGFDVSCVDSSSSTAVPSVTATAGINAASGTYSIHVDQLAEAAKKEGSSIANNKVSFTDISKWAGKDITLDVDGSKYTINLSASITTLSELKDEINNKISANTNLNGKISASSTTDNKIQFNIIGNNTIKIVSGTTTVTEADITTIAGKAIAPTTSTKLSDLTTGSVNSSLSLALKYNGTTKTITLDNSSGTKTVNDLINKITADTSGNVVASYSQLTGKFTLKTLGTGNGTSISVEAGSTASLLTALNITTGSGDSGKDAMVKITPPGGTETTVQKSTNSFSMDGVTYNLSKVNTADDHVTNITLTTNVDKTFDKIKGFIDKYNELIDKIQTKIEEKKQKDYLPLTDDQKSAMTEEQITTWETKAKKGILRGDSSLQNMLDSMRSAFFASVTGAGINLTDIGLNTSSDTSERGKILLTKDSTGDYKLKTALKEHGAQVINLFAQSSTTSYSIDNTSAQRNVRYNESGIFERINDIMKDYTNTTKNSSGIRGILVAKAGIADTTSAVDNLLYKDLVARDKAISEMKTKINDKQEAYYLQFSKLETYMNQMNSQSSWLSAQLSSGL